MGNYIPLGKSVAFRVINGEIVEFDPNEEYIRTNRYARKRAEAEGKAAAAKAAWEKKARTAAAFGKRLLTPEETRAFFEKEGYIVVPDVPLPELTARRGSQRPDSYPGMIFPVTYEKLMHWKDLWQNAEDGRSRWMASSHYAGFLQLARKYKVVYFEADPDDEDFKGLTPRLATKTVQ